MNKDFGWSEYFNSNSSAKDKNCEKIDNIISIKNLNFKKSIEKKKKSNLKCNFHNVINLQNKYYFLNKLIFHCQFLQKKNIKNSQFIENNLIKNL